MQSVNRHGTTPTQPQTDDTDTQNTVGKGADANPYLALSAVLAAIDHGIEQQLTPCAAETGNAYETGGTAVPPTLQQALGAFQRSAIASKAFSAEVVEHYAHLARLEIDHHHRLVTDVERHRWLARA
ncbi:hypothetical protein ACFYTG_38690 [Streptomyces mirabilis]|uniref:hypothetical protein n=1 Tax=Streptomyces mirabilis TaxID=68239 RepID=UPI0036CE431A